jgi:Zn-dependent protease
MAVFFLLFSDNYRLIIEIVGILILHELGHFFMMKKFGYNSLNILFIPIFGAMVSGEKKSISQRQKFWVSIMGPLPGVVLGIVGLLYYLNSPENQIVFELSLLLISINVLNLIPLDPLDGGHIVEALFFPTNSAAKMYFTLMSSLILIGLGLYFELFIIVIFGFFMSMKVRSFQKSQRIHDNLDEINFNYAKSYGELSNKEYWTIRRIFLENNPKIKAIIPDELSLWENEKLIVEQVKQILKLEIKKDLSISHKLILLFVFLLSIILPILLLLQNIDLIANTFFSAAA